MTSIDALRPGLQGTCLGRLLGEGKFRFDRLVIEGIDNAPVLSINDPRMREEETCLFHAGVGTGDDYVGMLESLVVSGMRERRALPVVRFADGEYAFYEGSLKCNGLYEQAESSRTIREAMPMHVEALRYVAGTGLLAPLVFPGNVSPKREGVLARLMKARGDGSAVRFLDFLSGGGIVLSRSNYCPFYAVYAWLSSPLFARAVDGRKVCIVNSDFDEKACREWFEEKGSHPAVAGVPIPASYVATRWETMRDDVLRRVPRDADLCLVGAGVGALPVCADISRHLHIPAVDAGHVLNMMNGLVDKSKGPRLYTLHR